MSEDTKILYQLNRKRLCLIAIPILGETATGWKVGEKVAIGGRITKPLPNRASRNIYFTDLQEALAALRPLVEEEARLLKERLLKVGVKADALADQVAHETLEAVGVIKHLPKEAKRRSETLGSYARVPKPIRLEEDDE